MKLVESFRDEAGKSRHRLIATLGRFVDVAARQSSALIHDLLRVIVQTTLDKGNGETNIATVRSIGHTWLLTSLWIDLVLNDASPRVLRRKR